MPVNKTASSESPFTPRRRTIATISGLAIGVSGLVLLGIGVETVHDWMVRTSYRFLWIPALLSEDYVVIGAAMTVSGFSVAVETEYFDKATISGSIGGFSGFLLLIMGLWTAADFVFFVSHPMTPIEALLFSIESTAAGLLLIAFGFESVRTSTNSLDEHSKIISVGFAVIATGVLLKLLPFLQ